MKRLLVVLSVAALPMIGCLGSPPEPAFQVTLRLSPTPPLIGPTRLIIDVVDVGGRAVSNAAVTVEGRPEERTGRAPTRGMATQEAAGRYVVPGFDLDVGGPLDDRRHGHRQHRRFDNQSLPHLRVRGVIDRPAPDRASPCPPQKTVRPRRLSTIEGCPLYARSHAGTTRGTLPAALRAFYLGAA